MTKNWLLKTACLCFAISATIAVFQGEAGQAVAVAVLAVAAAVAGGTWSDA